MSTLVQAVIADDEPHLRAHLIRLLSQLWPELTVAAEAGNGAEALEAITQHQPDLVFLDIRMPVMDGIAVARKLAAQAADMAVPLVVFATAYDEYAVDAFEAAAADYLLKPVARDRLSSTLERVKARLTQRARTDTAPQLQATLEALLARAPAPAPRYLTWLSVGQGDTTELIQSTDVVYFRSDAKYTSAFTADREHVLRLSLKELAEQLDPEQFWQIHRGLIVNVHDIAAAERDLRGRYTLQLRRRRETIRSSQAYGHRFKRM
jgi:DNA-binding LytR/AlgR family response regulator